MIKVKLLPRGKKHQITYRIVIAPDRSKFDGKFIDDLGFYTPQTKTLSLNKEKLADWQKKGAQLTLGVDKLLNPDKYPKKIKVKKEEKTKEIKTETVPVKETKPKEVTPEEKVSTESAKSEEVSTDKTASSEPAESAKPEEPKTE